MNILSHLSRHLLDVTEGGNWTEVNVLETLHDVTYQEAGKVTIASPNTIASLVHHLAYWNRVMKKRLLGIDVLVPESNGFDVQALTNVEDWTLLVHDYVLSTRELSESILSSDETRLWDPILPGRPSVYKSVQGSVEHIHYHLGQMVVIKKLVRATTGGTPQT